MTPQLPGPGTYHGSSNKGLKIAAVVGVVFFAGVLLHSASSSTPQASVDPSIAVSAPPAPTTPPTVVMTQESSGSGITDDFTVSGEWRLDYTFDCSGAGGQGNFIVQTDTNVPTLLLNRLGSGERGSHDSFTGWAGQTPQPEHLQVISECSWTISIVQVAS